MATSFLKSFMEAVNPVVGKAAKRAQDPQGCKIERRTWSEAAPNAPSTELTTKATLEGQSTWPEIVVVPQAMQEPLADGENVLEVSGEEIPSMELADQIAIHRRIPVMDPETTDNTDPDPVPASVDDSGSETGDIIQDAQFFQDAADWVSACTYQSLDEKYTQQAVLVKEASEALKASKSCVTKLQEQLMALKQNRDNDIQQAVGQAVITIWAINLLRSSPTHQEHQLAIAAIAGTGTSALQVSLASQRDLPSVGATQEGVNLRDEVFNYVPGTVNTNRGAVVFNSPDQAFSFQKHVRFRRQV